MHSATVIILLVAFIRQAWARDVKFADELLDRLFDQLSDHSSARESVTSDLDLDHALLGKAGEIATIPSASAIISRTSAPRRIPSSSRLPFPLRALPPKGTTLNTASLKSTEPVVKCPFTGKEKVDDVDVVAGIEGGKRIPGPKGLPADIISNTEHVMKIPIYGIEEATLRWGNSFGPIVRYDNKNLGIKSWVFVNEPDLIQHICANKAQLYEERYLPDIYRFATESKGILGSSGAFNKQHRKMCKGPFTNKKILKQFATATAEITNELVGAWRSSSPTGELQANIADHMQRLTLDVIGNVSFSYSFGGMDHVRKEVTGNLGKDSEQDKLIGYVNTWTEQVGKLAAPWITNSVLEMGTKYGDPRCTALQNSIQSMRSLLISIIGERRQQIEKGIDVPEDLMTELIRIQNTKGVESFTDTELWEDIHDVMGAGHETTANTLTTALWEVAMHPEVGVKIHEELDALLGVGPNRRLPTYEDFEHDAMPYTTAVIKETLRLYPPIPLFVREASRTDMLPGGYVIQEGDTVFMSAYALGRTERFWENVYHFDPDRFTKEKEEARGMWTWLPFGAGPRMCMGTRFAMMSTVLEFATILSAYSFSPVTPNYRTDKQSHIPYIGAWRGGMPFEYDMTICFPEGCTLKAVPRQ